MLFGPVCEGINKGGKIFYSSNVYVESFPVRIDGIREAVPVHVTNKGG